MYVYIKYAHIHLATEPKIYEAKLITEERNSSLIIIVGHFNTPFH